MPGLRTIGLTAVAFLTGSAAALGAVAMTSTAHGSTAIVSPGSALDSYSMLLNPAVLSSTPGSCDAQKGFLALAAVESAKTGESVKQIMVDLKAGKTLDQIAGAKDALVKQTALDDVQQILDFAVANGKVKAADESADLAKAKTWIDKAMALDVRTVPQAAKCTGHGGHGKNKGKPAATPTP